MYQPPAFREERPEVLHAAIRAHPLATLVTAGASGLIANLVPFALVGPDANDRLLLRSHLARANPQLADLEAGAETLLIFQGPQAYVSPSWYPSKREHGRAVPTWNYIMVQARGRPAVNDAPEWLRAQLDGITAQMEGGRPEPWAVSDAPTDYVAAQLRGIRGIEVEVSSLDGKWKVSQNQPEANRAGVVQGLCNGGHYALAAEIR